MSPFLQGDKLLEALESLQYFNVGAFKASFILLVVTECACVGAY